MKGLSLKMPLLLALLLGATATRAEATVTLTTSADSLYITTQDYGELASTLASDGNAIAQAVAAKKYAGCFLTGYYSSADLQALFNLSTVGSSTVANTVTKLVMRDATVSEIKFKGWLEKVTGDDGTEEEVAHKKLSFLDNTDTEGFPSDKTFPELAWWEMPKLKSASADGTYALPNTTQGLSLGNFMPNLSYVLINDCCTTVGTYLFRNSPSLTKVEALGSGLKKLDWGAFGYSTKLADIRGLLYAGVEEIGAYVFYGCGGIHAGGRADFLPPTLKKIGSSAFDNIHTQVNGQHTNNLGPVLVIPANVEEIGGGAFQNSGIEDVYFLGEKLPTCGNRAFTGDRDPYLIASVESLDVATHATRSYFNDRGMLYKDVTGQCAAAMLHYRPDLKASEIAKFTDATRQYTMKDKFLGAARPWPTWKEYKTVTENAGSGKNFKGDDFTDEQKKYQGLFNFAFAVADAPLPTAKVPVSGTTWRTLCLPFDLTIDSETKLYQLERVTRDAASRTVRLYFTKDASTDGVAKAWTPYLIKPGACSNYGAMLIAEQSLQKGSESILELTAEKVGTEQEDGDWTYWFLGNCTGLYHKSGATAETVSIDRPRYAYYLGQKDGEVSFFYQTTASQRVWSPYTCAVMAYHEAWQTDETPGLTVDDSFRSPSGQVQQAKTLVADLGLDGTTAIEQVIIVTPEAADPPADAGLSGNIYNLQGQLVRANVTTTEGLPCGIYVHQGKKIIVK